jgi:hypothetical protein
VFFIHRLGLVVQQWDGATPDYRGKIFGVTVSNDRCLGTNYACAAPFRRLQRVKAIVRIPWVLNRSRGYACSVSLSAVPLGLQQPAAVAGIIQ